MTTILAKLQSWALWLVAVLAVLVGAYAFGHRSATKAAAKDVENEDAKRALAGTAAATTVEADVRAMPEGAAAAELHDEWVRPAGDVGGPAAGPDKSSGT